MLDLCPFALEGLSKEVMVFPDIKNAQGWVSADMVKRWLDKARRALDDFESGEG